MRVASLFAALALAAVPFVAAQDEGDDVYKLLYFDVPGAAQPIRDLLTIAGQPFEDVRFKPATEKEGTFASYKETGELDSNLARAPVLFFNNIPIGESHAIARFVARKFGLMGDDEIEEAQADAIVEHVRDIKTDYQKVRLGKTGAELDTAKATFVKDTLPVWLGKVEKTISGTDGFAIGNRASIADVYLANLLFELFDDKAGALKAAEGAPKVLAAARRGEEAINEAKERAANPVKDEL